MKRINGKLPPEEWPDYSLRFKLRNDVHWWWNDEQNVAPLSGQEAQRVLVPELKQWLDDMDFPHDLKGFGTARRKNPPYIWFEDHDHAMLFKLTWYKTG